jgi:hypothetical protein
MSSFNVLGYEPTIHKVYISATAVILDPAVPPPTAPFTEIDYALNDYIDDAHSLKISLTARSGTLGLNLYDINCQMQWLDATTGDLLYQIAGILAPLPITSNATIDTLQNAADNSGYFDSFLCTNGAIPTPVSFFLGAANPAGNAVGSYRANKSKTLTVLGELGADGVPTSAFYDAVVQGLTTAITNPDYIVMPDLSNLQTVNAMMGVTSMLNITFVGELDGTLSPADATALANSLALQDYRAHLYYSPFKATPRDAVNPNVPKIWRPCVGVQMGYRLLRNAATNSSGIPPINIPISGYNFPINFKNMEALYPLDEFALNTLAEAQVNPVRFDQRYIFGDCLTQVNSPTSQLRLTNASEIETYTTNGVIAIVRRNLLRPMASHIRDSTVQCQKFLDSCSNAGLLVPSEDLGGLSYTISITPREDRPYDASNVVLARRCEGAARASYLSTSVNK